MFRRQHSRWDQNPWFVPETMSISQPLHIEVPPPPGFGHLPFKAVLWSVARCQVSYSLNSDLSTQFLIAELLYIELILARTVLQIEATRSYRSLLKENSSFHGSARSYRFNHTRLPKKKKKTLKVTKLTSWMNFRMTQAIIIRFERSTVERIEENSNDVSPALFIYMVMQINIHKYGHGEMRNKKVVYRRNDITQGWQFCSP